MQVRLLTLRKLLALISDGSSRMRKLSSMNEAMAKVLKESKIPA